MTILSLLGVPTEGFSGHPGLLGEEPGSAGAGPICAETRFRGANAAAIVDASDKLVWYQQG